jgi:hypothetical protein
MNSVERIMAINPLCGLSEETNVLAKKSISFKVRIRLLTHGGALVAGHSPRYGVQIPLVLEFLAVFIYSGEKQEM